MIDFPFTIKPFDNFVKEELANRKNNIGMDNSYNKNMLYKGPLSVWARATSFTVSDNFIGFVMTSTYGFENDYGFNPLNETILGYDVNNKKHVLKNDNLLMKLKHRPPPGIESIKVDMQGGAAKFRKINLSWKCYSVEQLEYMEKYFMLPQASVLVEFGWNNFNKNNLVNLKLKQEVNDIFTNDLKILEKVEKSNGRYEIIPGKITSFNYSVSELGLYTCTTEISSNSQLYNSLSSLHQNTDKVKTVIQSFSNKLRNRGMTTIKKYESGVLTLSELKHPIIQGKSFLSNNGSKTYYRLKEFFEFFNDHFNIDGSEIKYKFNIEEVFISAHPNIKTTDANILLIPNSASPYWQYFEEPTKYVNPIDKIQNELPEDKLLLEQYNNKARIDLNFILNESRNQINEKNDPFKHIDFPYRGQSDSLISKYMGKLGNLYVSEDLIRESFEGKSNVLNCIRNILDKISNAVGDYWNFSIEPLYPHSNTNISIRDLNFVSEKKSTAITKSAYIFNFFENNSEIISLNFDVKLSDSVTTEILFGTSVGTNRYVDWLKDSNVKDNVENDTKNNPIVSSNDDNLGSNIAKNDKRYAVIEVEPDIEIQSTGKKANLHYPMAEPNKTILEYIISKNKNPITLNSGIVPGISITLELLGIAGIRYLDYFIIKGLPKKYSDKVLFQVTKVLQSVDNGIWKTTIEAGIIPNGQ